MLASPEGVKKEYGAFSGHLTECVPAAAPPAPSFEPVHMFHF
jgi:hypothetical protein